VTTSDRAFRRDSFYGRRKGHNLRAGQAETLADVLDRLSIDLTSPPPAPLAALFSAPVDDVVLEIGFGGGEHLVHRATTEPRTGRIGVEPFVNGMAKLTASLDETPLDNVRLHDDDATVLLDWMPEASLDGIDLLYPDPWPKKKHWKRRFVSPVNLDRFARVVKPGGIFRFASDIDTYVNWTLVHIRAHGAFDWLAEGPEDWHTPYEAWPGTLYEAKAVREGRKPAYLTFKRR
jgi:tRNA (guanine-N7-)-methyltransferase